jgi:hypothetical protein
MVNKTSSKEQIERNSKIKGAISTLFFYLLLASGFIFLDMHMPIKPVAEGGLGMDVMLGNQMYGQENNSTDIYGPQGDIEPPAITKKTATKIRENAENEKLLTQDQEDAPPIVKNDDKSKEKLKDNKPDKDEKTDNKQSTENQRTSNPNFEYNKKSGNAGNGDDGVPGYKGKPNGNPNSKNMGDGDGHGNGTGPGVSWNLAGRKKITSHQPDYGDNKTDVVVIEIGVDQRGVVKEAK